MAITVVGTLAWLTLTWLVLAILLVAASNTPGRVGSLATVASAILVPAATQRLIAATLGVTLLTGMATGTATAAPAPAPATVPTAPSAISALDLDWPTRPGPPAASSPTPAPASAPTAIPSRSPIPATAPGTAATRGNDDTAAHQEVVVLRGESLWTIAARHLGPSATDQQIAHEWPRWWAVNRQVIGADPDLIKPGLRLVPPPTKR